MKLNELLNQKKSLFEEVAQKYGFSCSYISNNVFEFKKEEKRIFIDNFVWPSNSASSVAITNDKALAHTLLKKNQIPSVEQIVLNIQDSNIYEKAVSFFEIANKHVVLKPNASSGGKDVYFCEHDKDLFFRTFSSLITKFGVVNISKKVDVVNEYRCVFLHDKVEMIYLKRRPVVVGDSKSSLLSLLLRHQYKFIKLKAGLSEKLNTIPKKGEVVQLTDQDNHGIGCTEEIQSRDSELFPALEQLAAKAAKVLGLELCTVEILLDESGSLFVMEIYPAPQLEAVAIQNNKGMKRCLELYRKTLSFTLET